METKAVKSRVPLLTAAGLAMAVTTSWFAPAVMAKTVTISFMEVGDPAKIAAAKKSIAIFEKLHPDIRVKYYPESFVASREKMKVMIAAGTPYDVSPMYDMDYIKRGLVRKLDPFIKRDRFDLGQYLPDTLKGPNQIYKGSRYALPYGLTSIVQVYNKDLFDRNGVPYPTQNWASNDWTWEQFVSAAKKITRDDNGDGKTDTWGVGGMQWTYVYPLVWGQPMFNEDFSEFICNTPAGAKAFQLLADLIWKDKVQPASGAPFNSGKVGMSVEGAWALPELQKTKAQWDMAATPKGVRRATHVYTDSLLMAANCKHPDAAWEFIKFMTASEDAQKIWTFEGNGKAPSIKSLKPWYVKQAVAGQRSKCNLDVIFDALPYNVVMTDISRAPNWEKVWAAFDAGLAKVFSNKASADQVLNSLKPQIDKIIKVKK